MPIELATQVRSGIEALDRTVQGLRLGDNVVWQVDTLADYRYVAQPFADRALADGRTCVYLRFAPHPPVLDPRPGLEIVPVDPSPGFDAFTGAVHRIIEAYGPETFYIFDNLSALVEAWTTDALLANFFQVTCPYLFELDTVTYFALTRGQHAHHAIARIRETTQLLINVINAGGRRYVHPLKVWDRYSGDMFLPHVVTEDDWRPILSSGDAAEVHALSRTRPLGAKASAYAPWDTVYGKLQQHRANGRAPDAAPEIRALKRQFMQMMLGSQPEFEQLADRYFELDDLFAIHDRLIGRGRIGGKAAGMLLARKILTDHPGISDLGAALENHDSFYVGSDVFFTFLVHNDLFRLRLQLLDDPDFSHEAFAEVRARFLEGEFPAAIVEQFRNMLDYYGQAPIIVRSSSLLEDGFGNAFAGKYRSEFCANQGSPEQRLYTFLRAVKLVYASALNPDVLTYRRKWGLAERDEQMAVLVQRVSGGRHGPYFFPTLAGVALSHNLYVWADRIDPNRGVIRLVFGLGTRAVDRVGNDYPRMIPLSHPNLRPEIGVGIAKYAQRHVDVIDLERNVFVTRPFREIVNDTRYPNLHLLISELRDGGVYDPISRNLGRRDRPGRSRILTFNNLIRRTDFVPLLDEMLTTLEDVYGRPVDTEFTASLGPDGAVRINLLQCRPMNIPGISERVALPDDLPPERVILRSTRFIGGGVADGIRYLVAIDPAAYAQIPSMETKRAVRSVVGRINARLREAGARMILLGPGRFGSSNVNLGVNVRYADIDRAAVLVELGGEGHDQAPEVSYGTHFFLDLVESQMLYLAVSPDEELNRAFLDRADNCLGEMIPERAHFASLIKVIDLDTVVEGRTLSVVADPHSKRALCYLVA
jgi:pyruvate, water dikinase